MKATHTTTNSAARMTLTGLFAAMITLMTAYICHIPYGANGCLLYTSVGVAQLDRAFGYGPKGRGFESSNAR